MVQVIIDGNTDKIGIVVGWTQDGGMTFAVVMIDRKFEAISIERLNFNAWSD